LDAEELAETINDYSGSGHMITLDRQEGVLQGGTGLSFDWQIASKLSKMGFKFVLAGGLTPSNVGEAIKIINPWGVDVSSGVETDGIKDSDKIEAFIRQSKIASL
jgi:phosphoribosylanthranilate isomerase